VSAAVAAAGAPPDFWIGSGHHLCDRDAGGRLLATPDLWRAFLARPELLPPPEACARERALHRALLEEPALAVDEAALAGLDDSDARDNYRHFLGFRDRVRAAPTLESAWVALFRGGVAGVPPVLLQMLTHLVARAAMEGERDAFALRAAECLFRPQRAAIHQGATLLADEEALELRAEEGDLGPLGQLLEEAGAAPRGVELDVLGDDNAGGYIGRSEGHDLALDVAPGRPGAAGMARALERFASHVLGARASVRPVPSVRDGEWGWHVGLDTEATAIGNALWRGERVAQERLARILWLGVLEFEPGAPVLEHARGVPVLLALAMDPARRVRVKPQNLLAGLPLHPGAAG